MKKKDKFGKKMVFIVRADVFKQDILVILNGEIDDGIKFLKKIKSKPAEENIEYLKKIKLEETDKHKQVQGTTYPHLPFGLLIMTGHKDTWIETVGIVSHECTHATHYIFRDIRIPLTEESEEAYTYLQQHLMTQILNKMY